MQSVLSRSSSGLGCSPPCRLHAQQQQRTKQQSSAVACAAAPHWAQHQSSTQQQQRDAASGTDAFKRLMAGPGGAWFMSADADAAPVYGDSFIMQQTAGSRAAAGTGLVRLLRPQRAMAAVQPTQRDIVPLSMEDVEVSIVVLSADGASSTTTTLTALSTTSSSTGTSSIVPFRRLLADPSNDAGDNDDDSSSKTSSLAIVPRDNTMLGVVMSSAVRRRDNGVPLPTDDEAVYETPFNDKNPRRTMKIKFKCRRCGATTIKPINPHAWATGTVFAKCGCCQVTHKLIDNLKLFHELAGPVFGPGTQGPPAPKRERLGLRLESDSTTLPDLPPRLRLRLPLDGFPDDTAGLN